MCALGLQVPIQLQVKPSCSFRTGEHYLPVQIDFEPFKPARSVVMVLRLLYSLLLRPEIGR